MRDGDLYILPGGDGNRNGNFLVRVRIFRRAGGLWMEYISPNTRQASGSSGTWPPARFEAGVRIPKHVKVHHRRQGCGRFYWTDDTLNVTPATRDPLAVRGEGR